MTDKTLTIRPADLADLAALDRLAALDSASPPTGDVLVAEVGGELWAAIDGRDRRARSPTRSAQARDLVELLRARRAASGACRAGPSGACCPARRKPQRQKVPSATAAPRGRRLRSQLPQELR